MADPTEDANLTGPSDHEGRAQAAMQAAERGMAKAGDGAQDLPESESESEQVESRADPFVEQEVSREQASDAEAGDGQGDAGSAVNSQASESVALTNGLSADGAPVIAEAGLAQVAAQAKGLALLNAVNAQQNAYVTANAAVVAIVARILALAPPSPGDRADG